MAKTAVQYKASAHTVYQAVEGRVIDIRTRKPWRRPEPTNWTFLFDLALTFTLMLIGAWLFLKMRGE
jgi:predicted lysophospholipase L1 biosynthesis ABC-type transport system permease subunit